MRVLFTVQGDGRGHMTQAIAFREMLERHGHEIVGVLAGSNQSRTLPAFFRDAFGCPVNTFSSPGFSIKKGRAISTIRSAIHFVSNLRTYRESLKQIDQTIVECRPDLLVNFLEPLVGWFNLRRGTHVPTLSVAHHFMFEHPVYPKAKGFPVQKVGMMLYTRLTGANATRLALSFYPAPDLPKKRIVVCPPILRRQLFELKPDPNGRYLLIYLLNHGYASEIRRWHDLHPEVPLHCFYDKPGAPPEEQVTPNLTFHALHGEKYLRLMAGARGVVCTAGFESISEAAYLGKSLLMVPVQNHPEQHVNSIDAELAGLGKRADVFDLIRAMDAPNSAAQAGFRRWVDQAESVVVRAAELAATGFAQDRLPAKSRAGLRVASAKGRV